MTTYIPGYTMTPTGATLLSRHPLHFLTAADTVDFVFDLSDTEPIDPKDDRVPEIVSNPFPARGAPPVGALERLMQGCSLVQIQVVFKDFGTNLAGRVQRLYQPRDSFYIAINVKHTEAQQLGALAHELAHVFCGHLGQTEVGFWPNRPRPDRIVREFEAEVVAYLVTERLNLDIGSVEYLSSYLTSEMTLPKHSLDAVLKAVGKTEEMLQDRFRPKRRS